MSGAASNPVLLSSWPLSSRLPFLSGLMHRHTTLSSNLLQAVLHRDKTTYLLLLNNPSSHSNKMMQWVLFFSRNFSPSKWVKIRIVKSCRRDGKVLRRGETWHRQDSSVCVCARVSPLSFQGPGVFTEVWSKTRRAPMAISVTEHNRSTFPENFAQWNWVWYVGVTSLKQ